MGPPHRYIEWLEVVTQCGDGQGYLIVFDLSGDAAMSSSVNCAMEIAILYRLFTAGDSGLRLIVLTDKDVILDDEKKLAAVLRAKENDPEAQKELFDKAYSDCYAFLQSYFAETNGLHEVGRKWTREFQQAGGGHHGVRRLSVAIDSSTSRPNLQDVEGTQSTDGKGKRPSGAGSSAAELAQCINPMFKAHAGTCSGPEGHQGNF